MALALIIIVSAIAFLRQQSSPTGDEPDQWVLAGGQVTNSGAGRRSVSFEHPSRLTEGGLASLQRFEEERVDSLFLSQANIETLKGLPPGTGIQEITLVGCQRLRSLAGLEAVADSLATLNVIECDSLQTLDIAGGPYPELKTINVTACSALSTFAEFGTQTPNLKLLRIVDCGSIEVITGFSEGSGPETLEVRHCGALKRIETAAPLHDLRKLTLVGNAMFTDLNGVVQSFPALSTLVLSGDEWNLSRSGGEIAQLPYLESIELDSFGSAEMIRDFAPVAPRLESLVLANSHVDSLSAVGSLPGLRTLRLAGIRGLADLDGLQKLVGLRTLVLDGCADLVSLQGLPAELPQLTRCEIWGSAIKDLDGLPETLPSLRELALDECGSLRVLKSHGPFDVAQLHRLVLTYCRSFDGCLSTIVAPRLSLLDLSGMKRSTVQCILTGDLERFPALKAIGLDSETTAQLDLPHDFGVALWTQDEFLRRHPR